MTVKEYNKAVDLYSDGVFRFIMKNARNEELAKDIVQDAFAKLWEKREEVNAEKSKSYLFTSAYRRMIDIIRRSKKQGNWDDSYENIYVHRESYSGLGEILEKALAKLPEIQRAVILLRDYEGYDYQEISEILSLSLSQVKVYIFRGRKFLKEYLVSIETVV